MFLFAPMAIAAALCSAVTMDKPATKVFKSVIVILVNSVSSNKHGE